MQVDDKGNDDNDDCELRRKRIESTERGIEVGIGTPPGIPEMTATEKRLRIIREPLVGAGVDIDFDGRESPRTSSSSTNGPGER